MPVDGGFASRSLGEGGVGREGDVVEHAAAGGAAGEARGVVCVRVDVGAAAGAPDLFCWLVLVGGEREGVVGGVRKKKRKRVRKKEKEARGGGG
jgi:hypothetical protein